MGKAICVCSLVTDQSAWSAVGEAERQAKRGAGEEGPLLLPQAASGQGWQRTPWLDHGAQRRK